MSTWFVSKTKTYQMFQNVGAAALMDSNVPCNVFRVPSMLFLPKNLLQAHVYSLHIFSSCPKTRSISLNVKVRHFWNKNFKMNSSLGCLGYIRLPDIFQFSIEPKSLPVVTFYHLQDKRSRQETNHFPYLHFCFVKVSFCFIITLCPRVNFFCRVLLLNEIVAGGNFTWDLFLMSKGGWPDFQFIGEKSHWVPN